MTDSKKIEDGGPANVRWLPIALADKTITDVQEFEEVGITIKTSDRYWVRDEDGRVYEAAWSEGNYGRDYWWDFEGESPVDPVEFMPHPLDPRWIDAERCPTCDGTGMEARHQLCRDCDDVAALSSSGGHDHG